MFIYPAFEILFQVIFAITGFVIVISLVGATTGVREICAKFLLWLFEWAATTSGERRFSDNCCDSDDEERIEADYRKISQRHRPYEKQSIILRRWTAEMEEKLRREESDTTFGFSSQHQHDGGDGDEGGDESGTLPDNVKTVKLIVNDTLELVAAGFEAIIQDDVTSRFAAAHLPSWNMLMRNRHHYAHISWKLTLIWLIGLIFRYTVLVPVRLLLFLLSMVLMSVISATIGFIPNRRMRAVMNRYTMLMCMRISSRSFSTIVTFHDRENCPTHGICVANHTSPIDVMILSCDNCYAMIGQRQGGILGVIQKALSRCSDHIWFERTESRDRMGVTQSLAEHVEDPNKLPILIFPEGTCINNTSVMQFKKGSFEVTDIVHPIVLKYDSRLGDPFWNSSEQGYMAYLTSMMTAWAIMCDVWYLPPVKRKEGEAPIEFARRVQKMIARKGGMLDLDWDGNLKRSKVPERLKTEQRKLLYQHLSRASFDRRSHAEDENE